MVKLTLDETVHDNGRKKTEEKPSTDQTSVDDLCLCIHLLSLFAIGEGGEARSDKGVEE